MSDKKFRVRDRLHSFVFAFSGIKTLFTSGHNIWIHSLVASAAVTAGFICRLSRSEWIAVIIAIGLVFISEAINTAIEKLADFVSPEKQDAIKKIKDLAAAAVLISSITALIMGLVIFLPLIIGIFRHV